MLKKLLFFLLSFIALHSAWSQELSLSKGNTPSRFLSEKSNDSLVNNSKSTLPVPKTTFDSSQKITPEVFYIVNDKPVSREEYLRHNQKNHKI